MTEEEKRTFCRIVATLVVSDLKLKDSELEYMDRLYNRLGVDEATQKAIQAKVNLRDDVGALAKTLSEPAREALLETLQEAASVDGEVADTEAAIIERVRAAFA